MVKVAIPEAPEPDVVELPKSLKNIYQRILAVMADVSYVQKEDRKVNNQYTFVSHDAVIAKIRPALIQHGIAVIPTVSQFRQEGNNTIVYYDVTLVNIDKPDDIVVVRTIGYGVDPQDKGPGKAMSYAYKYAMLKVFCLETGDDPERDNIPRDSTAEVAQPPKPKVDVGVENYLVLLDNAATENGLDPEMRAAVLAKYRAMAPNMGFAAWKHAIEGAIEKIRKLPQSTD